MFFVGFITALCITSNSPKQETASAVEATMAGPKSLSEMNEDILSQDWLVQYKELIGMDALLAKLPPEADVSTWGLEETDTEKWFADVSLSELSDEEISSIAHSMCDITGDYAKFTIEKVVKELEFRKDLFGVVKDVAIYCKEKEIIK